MNKLLATATLVGLVILGQGTAHAVPILQLYIEGSIYDDTTETWVWYPGVSGTTGPPRLWAIGNVSGPGSKGTISDVRLSIAYSLDDPGPVDVTLTPSTTGGYGGFTDPLAPVAPSYIQTVTDGSSPVLGDGSSLPPHGIFGPGTIWQEYLLGDFELSDSPMGDFIGSFPTPTKKPRGQINVYEVSVTGGVGWVHFDLYDTVIASNRGAVFAPFSHDAEMVPEPASFIVWFLIGLTWAGSAWTHQYRRRWQKWQREEAVGADGSRADDPVDRFAGRGDDVAARVALPTLSQFPAGADGPSAGG